MLIRMVRQTLIILTRILMELLKVTAPMLILTLRLVLVTAMPTLVETRQWDIAPTPTLVARQPVFSATQIPVGTLVVKVPMPTRAAPQDLR